MRFSRLAWGRPFKLRAKQSAHDVLRRQDVQHLLQLTESAVEALGSSASLDQVIEGRQDITRIHLEGSASADPVQRAQGAVRCKAGLALGKILCGPDECAVIHRRASCQFARQRVP